MRQRIALIAFAAVLIGGLQFLPTPSSRSSNQVATPQLIATTADDPRLIADQVQISDWSWRKGGFDTVAFVRLTLENRNKFAIKDIAVECQFRAKSGTLLTQLRRTVFDTIAAGQKKRFKELSFGIIHDQASSAGCSVAQAVRQ